MHRPSRDISKELQCSRALACTLRLSNRSNIANATGAQTMSIGGIGNESSWWYQAQASQAQASQASQASQAAPADASATGSSGSVSNTGTIAATSNFASFLQAFSADLQAMLTQMRSAASSTATSPATAATTPATTTASGTTAAASTSATTASTTNPTSQTASTQPQDEAHHHHHHHSGGGGDSSMQAAADQMIGAIGQSLQNGTQTASTVSNSASSFAADLIQAMQAYGSNAPTSSALAALV
jgi:hypothetical protein